MDETREFIIDNIRGMRIIEEVYELKFNDEENAFDFKDAYDSKDTIDFYFLCLECEEEFNDLQSIVEHIPHCNTDEKDSEPDNEKDSEPDNVEKMLKQIQNKY